MINKNEPNVNSLHLFYTSFEGLDENIDAALTGNDNSNTESATSFQKRTSLIILISTGLWVCHTSGSFYRLLPQLVEFKSNCVSFLSVLMGMLYISHRC